MAESGIDISAHQKDRLDVRAVRAESRFIAVKQTEGLTWPEVDDPAAADLLRRWRAEAQDGAFEVIILYHYLRPQPGRTGTQEADHLIDFVGDLEANEAVAIDDEWDGATRGGEHEDFVVEFIDRIEQRFPDRAGKILYYSSPAYLTSVSTERVVDRSPCGSPRTGPMMVSRKRMRSASTGGRRTGACCGSSPRQPRSLLASQVPIRPASTSTSA